MTEDYPIVQKTLPTLAESGLFICFVSEDCDGLDLDKS